MQGDRYFATIEFNTGMAPTNAMKVRDNLLVNGKLAVRVVEEPSGVTFYAVPPPTEKGLGVLSNFGDDGEEAPMIKETVDVVSARARKLEEENTYLHGQLSMKDERIEFLLNANRDLNNFLMSVTRTALGKLRPEAKNGTETPAEAAADDGAGSAD